MSTAEAPSAGRTPLRYIAGDVINDRYRVLEQLGHGASGAVYRVDDLYRGNELALKVLDPSVDIGAARREFDAAWNVVHPNVVRLIDIGRTTTEPPCWLIAQELVEGCSLDSYCAQGKDRLELPDVIDCVIQILDALEAIHPNVERIAELEALQRDAGALDLDDFHELQDLKSKGVIHRDIKPQNIRRRPDGVVKLIDFGIASQANSTVHTRSATPEYVPPDADLFAWEPSYDLFAVGVIAFELSTGESPFIDEKPALGRAPVPTTSVPKSVMQVIESSISADPHERFADAATMRRAFTAVAIEPVDEAEAVSRHGSPVAEAASAAGVADLYERAIDIASRRQLGVREYKRSLMITPGRNRSRYLVNLAFHPDHCGIGISPSNWASFFAIEERDVLNALGADHSSNMDRSELEQFLDRFEAVISAAVQAEPDRDPSPAQQIVDFLARNPGTHGIDEIAAGTGLGRGTVRRRVSTLTTDDCPMKLRGRVVSAGRNAYSAAAADSANA